MDILGILPARGGSKGIPNKNIALLGGRPMLAYTCEAATASQWLTRIILSTDDQKIAEIGHTFGVEIPFQRPAELAKDDTPMIDVLSHVLVWLQKNEGYQPEIVVLLQPTSPLRRAEHIDTAIDILRQSGAESVVSVVEVPHQFNPVSVMRIENGRLMPFLERPFPSIRQNKPLLYARNGPAVLAVLREVISEKNSLYGDDCRPFVMDAEDSIDVDTSFDLEIASFLLTRRKARGLGESQCQED